MHSNNKIDNENKVSIVTIWLCETYENEFNASFLSINQTGHLPLH